MNKKGFTMIELLVVVAIISVLAAIAIPYYYKYTISAKKAQVKSDVRNAVAEIFLFNQNYQNFPQLNPDPCTEDLTVCDLTNGTNNKRLNKTRGVILELNIIDECPHM